MTDILRPIGMIFGKRWSSDLSCTACRPSYTIYKVIGHEEVLYGGCLFREEVLETLEIGMFDQPVTQKDPERV